MKVILKYLKPYRMLLIGSFLLIVVRAFLELMVPKYLGDFINEIIVITSTSSSLKFTDKATLSLILMLVYTILTIIASMIGGFLEAKIIAGYSRDLRKALYDKVISLSTNDINEVTISSLITRCTDDVKQTEQFLVNSFRMIILQPFFIVGGIVYSILIHPTLTLVLAAGIFSILFFLFVLSLIVFPKIKVIQKILDKLNLYTRETISGLRVIRAFNKEEYHQVKFDEANMKNHKMMRFFSISMSLLRPYITLLIGLIWVAISYFGGTYFVSKGIKPGDLFSLIQYAIRVIMGLLILGFVFSSIPRAIVSVNRVKEVLLKESSMKEEKDLYKIYKENNIFYIKDLKTNIIKEFLGKITFKNVSFKYEGAKSAILSNLNFEIKPNQTVAFIGSTGSGKSTLINLIPRFYDVTGGTILIDDIDIKKFSYFDLRSLIGYVPQKGYLFKGSIKENVAFGKEIENEKIDGYLKLSKAYDFVYNLENKLEYQVSQGGTNISGGQRQRLSIARALACEPKIFVFDDSFSALDYITDKEVRSNLSKINATKLIVAQRISTIKNADLIVVLEKGKVCGIGKHEELFNKCLCYREIALSQLSKEELS